MDDFMYQLHKFITVLIFVFVIGCVYMILVQPIAHGAEIDMKKIAQIESSGCKEKFGKYEHARGCWQITKPVITEWNQFNPKDKHSLEDMLDDAKCFKVANWYMNKRIPQMLKALGLKDSISNRIIAYNAGVKAVKTGVIPKVTQAYLRKYGV